MKNKSEAMVFMTSDLFLCSPLKVLFGSFSFKKKNIRYHPLGLKLSFNPTERLKTKRSGVESRLSTQK